MVKYKQKYFLLFKRKILRQLRDEKNLEAEQILVDRERQTMWAMKALTFLLV